MAVYFNQIANDNKYVGYMYPGEKEKASVDFDDAHKVDSQSTKSDALVQIELWYNEDTNLGELLEQYIDVDTGFCSDSSLAKGNHGNYSGSGYGTQQTAYAGIDRVWQSGSTNVANPQTPTLKCGYDVIDKKLDKNAQKRDLYTGPSSKGMKSNNGTVEGNNALPVPVGLITSDEVVYAGGFGGTANANYWLKTDKYYWTMSPQLFFSGYARMFILCNDGQLNGGGAQGTGQGVRPVINLKANVKLSGSGTTTDPYIVETS